MRRQSDVSIFQNRRKLVRIIAECQEDHQHYAAQELRPDQDNGGQAVHSELGELFRSKTASSRT